MRPRSPFEERRRRRGVRPQLRRSSVRLPCAHRGRGLHAACRWMRPCGPAHDRWHRGGMRPDLRRSVPSWVGRRGDSHADAAGCGCEVPLRSDGTTEACGNARRSGRSVPPLCDRWRAPHGILPLVAARPAQARRYRRGRRPQLRRSVRLPCAGRGCGLRCWMRPCSRAQERRHQRGRPVPPWGDRRTCTTRTLSLDGAMQPRSEAQAPPRAVAAAVKQAEVCWLLDGPVGSPTEAFGGQCPLGQGPCMG